MRRLIYPCTCFLPRIENSSRKRQRGLTLIEIVVVLIIIGLALGLLVPKVFQSGEKAKADLTATRMQQLKSSILEYRLRYNKLPSTLEDLVSCNQITGAVCIPVASIEDLGDAWGNRMLYSLEGGGSKFRITSLGADGQPGGSGVASDPVLVGP